MTDWKSLGSELRSLRNGKGLSLREAGKLTGYHHTYLSRVENGVDPVSCNLLEALSRFYRFDYLNFVSVYGIHNEPPQKRRRSRGFQGRRRQKGFEEQPYEGPRKSFRLILAAEVIVPDLPDAREKAEAALNEFRQQVRNYADFGVCVYQPTVQEIHEMGYEPRKNG